MTTTIAPDPADEAKADAAEPLPLVFDMDGVWVTSDISVELLLQYIKSDPLRAPFRILRWSMSGKAHLKSRLEEAVGHTIDVMSLPLNQSLMETPVYVNASERVLVSGSNQKIVTRIADTNPDFVEAHGSSETRNLTGRNKADMLREKYPNGFSYIGDSREDVEVWEAATHAYAVHASKKTLRAAGSRKIRVEVLEARPSQWLTLVESMRLHQWSKNTLIFMMAFLSLQMFQPSWIWQMGLAFLSFGLIASATYIVNDLFDLQADRQHPKKRDRPLASGRLRLDFAIKSVFAMAALGLLLALPVGLELVAMLVGYAAISLAYSFRLKKVAILDTITLSLLFCWRIMTGAFVLQLELVPWFTAALALFFLSLALGKRGIELQAKSAALPKRKTKTKTDGTVALAGRGYRVDDYPVVVAMGVAAGLGSALVTMIYALMSEYSIIAEPVLAFGVCATLAYWLGYVWMTINRGEMDHDPIIFALGDKRSLGVLGLIGAMILAGQLF